MGADARGAQRRVLRFRLRFDAPTPNEPLGLDDPSESREPSRQSREFDPQRRPTAAGRQRRVPDPAEAAALTEKAKQNHHDLLAALHARLVALGWTEIGEIPVAIDLWGREASGRRWIFEAKTVHPGGELARVRSGLAQLLEYRFLYGCADDDLCLVTNGPIGDRHARVLGSLGVCVLTIDTHVIRPGSDITTSRLGHVIADEPEAVA